MSKVTDHYRKREGLSPSQKEEVLQYLNPTIRAEFICSNVRRYPRSSVISLIKDELVKNALKYLPALDDYFKRTEQSSYEEASREFVVLYASYLLVQRRTINVNKIKYRSVVRNCTNFVSCNFLIP